MLACPPLTTILQEIGTDSIQLQITNDRNIARYCERDYPHDTVLACPPLAIIMQDIVREYTTTDY